MAFIEEYRFDIKEGQFAAYQAWLAANEEELKKHMPEGREYLGTYMCIFGDTGRGSARTLIRLDSYAAMDSGVAAMREGGRYAELIEEAVAFTETGTVARGDHELWKEVTDTVYTGD